LSDTKTSLEKNAPDGETGIGLALVRASCRIACFRRHPVSEVCYSDGFLLAFRLALLHHKNAAALNLPGTLAIAAKCGDERSALIKSAACGGLAIFRKRARHKLVD
jgi:hypothetical protein